MAAALWLVCPFLVIGFLNPAFARAAEGPVASYSFDEGAGSMVHDDSGNGHNGRVEDAEWTEAGKHAGAIVLDGEEGHCVTVPSSEDLQLTEGFTLEAWIKPEGEDDSEPVIYKDYGEGWYFTYTLFPGVFGSELHPEGATSYEAYSSNNREGSEPLLDGAWSHIVLTYDGEDSHLYVDGEEVDSGEASGVVESEGDLYIGCAPKWEDGFTGLIDDLRIYDRALSAEELEEDEESAVEPLPLASPVAAYSFDEGEGEVAHDATGNGHNGAVEGAEWSEAGRFAGALDFNSEEEDCVTVPNSEDLQLEDEFTLEAWVKPEGDGEEDPIFFKEAEHFVSYGLYVGFSKAGRPEAVVAPQPYELVKVEGEEEVPENSWTHIAATYDGDWLRLYVDGELVDTTSAWNVVESEGPLRIGCSRDWEEAFNGKIDNARIYDRTLRARELEEDEGEAVEGAAPPPSTPPVASYSFDEGEGTVAYDSSGNGHSGSLHGGVEWTSEGRHGGALEFDGEGAEVRIPAGKALDVTEGFTLEAWVTPGEGVEPKPIFSQEDEGAGEEEELYAYSLYAGPGDNPWGWVRKAGGGHATVYGTEEIPAGSWSHVALSDDGEHLRLYVDGELESTAPASAITASEGNLLIGADVWGEHFKGLIDDVRIYGRALKEAEVNEDKETAVPTGDVIGGTITPTAKGAAQEISFTAPGEVARYSVPVSAGEPISIRSSAASLSENYRLEWFDPEGEPVKSWQSLSEVPGFFEAVRFEEAGTATLIVDPEGDATGSVSLTLYDASDKTTDTIVPSAEGSTKALSVDVPEQRSRISFEGTEGQWLSILPSAAEFAGEFHVTGPKGETLGNSGGGLAENHGPIRLPESGTYEILLTGSEGEVGRVDLCARLISEATPDSSCGPVAAFSFNEGAGDLVRDEGGRLDGIANGPSWSTRGWFGGALEFDGKDDMATLPDSSNLDLTGSFTLEAWVRPSTSSGMGDIFAKEDSESPFHSYLLYAYAAGEGPRGIAGTESWTASSEALPVESWSYVSFTSNGSETHLYVNGKLKASGTAAPLAHTGGPLQIGGNSIWGDYFKGRIDEVRVYDRSLSSTELATDMHTSVPKAPRPDPVAELGLNEDEGGLAHDSVARHNAVLQGASWSEGRFGSGLDFGEEGDLAQVGKSSALDFPKAFTAEAWVKPESAAGSATILAKRDSDESSTFGYRLYLAGEEGVLTAEIADGEGHTATIADPEPLPLGVWSHVALTSDGSEARLYVYGSLVASGPSVPSKATDGPLDIGGGEGERSFDGEVDEVRLYAARLSSFEISRDMETGVVPSHGEPSMALRFDEDAGEIAHDSAGEHDGTIQGATHRGERDGSVLALNGEADRVSVPDSPELELQEEGFTLSAWVYPTASAPWSPVMVKADPGEGKTEYDYALYSRGGGEGPAARVVTEEGEASYAISGETALPLNSWSLLALAGSGNEMRLYVNGAQVATGEMSKPRVGTGDLEIGGSTSPGKYFSGRLDDVELYNEALSEKEIEATLDTSPPQLNISGPLFESRGGPLGVKTADLHINASDEGEGASGLRSVEVSIDGHVVDVFRCGCEEQLTFTYERAQWGPGPHWISVAATDRHDLRSDQVFTIDEPSGPSIALEGLLFAKRGSPMGVKERELTIRAAQTDHSALAPRPGVKSLQVFVDGSPVMEPVTQSCEEGNCDLESSWTLDPSEYSTGSHRIRVEAVDQDGSASSQAFEVSVKPTDPCADSGGEEPPEGCALSGYQVLKADEFEELEGEGRHLVAEEWVQPGTPNERRLTEGEATRGTAPCPEGDEGTCGEVRLFGSYEEGDNEFFVTYSEDPEDPKLETVTDLNGFDQARAGEPIATGPIEEAIASWQDAPPDHGSTYELFEEDNLEEGELEEEEEEEETGSVPTIKTLWWIDSGTGLPLRKVEKFGSGSAATVIRRMYFEFDQEEVSAASLWPNFFLAEKPWWAEIEVLRSVEDEPGDLTLVEEE